jgi:hypothetical protein
MDEPNEMEMAPELEAAWQGFRSRLADALAAMSDDDVMVIEVETGTSEEELEGAAPYVQFLCWDDGRALRAEVAGNDYLDARHALTAEAEDLLLEIGWESPADDSGNFWTFGELRDADRLAAMAVRALREAFGVLHPAFLVGGLPGDDAPDSSPAPAAGPGADDEPLGVMPESDEHLRQLVDDALAPMLGGEVHHDGDGDVPIRTGSSVLFVHVEEERPEIRVFAILVDEIAHPERLPVELDILNREQRFARFYCNGDRVLLSHEICAVPFAARQLRAVVADLLMRVDSIARDLAARVGGQPWAEELADDSAAPTGRHAATASLEELVRLDDPGLEMLLELLATGPLDTRVVADLLDGDRLGIIRRIVGIRTGVVPTDGQPAEVVLEHLRRALRYVVDGDLPERGRSSRRLPRRPSQQFALVDDAELGQGTLEVE